MKDLCSFGDLNVAGNWYLIVTLYGPLWSCPVTLYFACSFGTRLLWPSGLVALWACGPLGLWPCGPVALLPYELNFVMWFYSTILWWKRFVLSKFRSFGTHLNFYDFSHSFLYQIYILANSVKLWKELKVVRNWY